MTTAPPPHPGRARPGHAWAAVALLALLHAAPGLGAPDTGPAQVYRCQGPDGAIEFRQEPCPAGSPGERLTIEDHPTGWTPVPEGQGAGPRSTGRSPKQSAGQRHHTGPSARERLAQECGKKRQQVEDIDRKLRLGTSGRQASDLRHRRARLEDFLFEQCN